MLEQATSRNPLADGLESFFSILPDEQALEAQQKTLENYFSRNDLLEHRVKWANFDTKGRFINGGSSDLAGLSTQLIVAERDNDPDINRLVEKVKHGDAKPGLLEYSISLNAIFWFLPFLIESKDALPTYGMRALMIPESLVHEILDIFNGEIRLTQAEKHLVFQLAAGLSLRQAAEMDDLAFETKRAQLKTICSKMQCGGQTDLLSHVLGQLAFLFSVCELRKERSGKLEAFARDYLAPDTRMTVQRLSSGRSIRILERGPIDGTPVLLMHGMLWPMLFTGESIALHAQGIRLLVPIRAGYIDNRIGNDDQSDNDLVALSLEDIALYQKETIGRAVTVIGYSNGGSIALRFAKLFPELVSRLFIVSINSAPGAERSMSFVGRFFAGIKYFANRPGVLRYLTWQFKKYYTDEPTVTRIMRKIFEASSSDSDLIDGMRDIPPIYQWFVNLFQHSIPSIADDFKYVMGNWSKDLLELETEVCFIHGTEDPLVSVETLNSLVACKPGVVVKPIPGAGHHLLSSHPDQVWKKISSY